MYRAKKTALVAFAALITSFGYPFMSFADNSKVHDYDWIINLETTELKDVLNYKTSGLKNPIKVHVTALEAGKPDDQAVPYEDFWFVNGLPFGQEKLRRLEIPVGKQVAFRVVNKDSQSDSKHDLAAANAILRLLVETHLKGIMLTAVRVPQESFSSIIADLQNLGFQPAQESSPDQARPSSVLLFVVCETDDSMKQTLEYNG